MNDRGGPTAPTVRLCAPVDPRPRRDVGAPFRRLNAGWLALDFVNTVSGWVPGGGETPGAWGDRVATERLVHYNDLLEWSRLGDGIDDHTAGVLATAAANEPRRAQAVMRRARALRGALFRLFRAGIEGWSPPPEDLATVNAEMRRLRQSEVLVPADRAFAVEWRSEADLQALLWPPLTSARTLLASPDLLARVGRCDGAGCGWLHIDIGRGRSRRWCDTRDCGNVAKVRAYRRRAADLRAAARDPDDDP